MTKKKGASRGYGGGSVRKTDVYNKVASHAYEVVEGLLELSKSKHPNIRLGAYNKLIDKIVPNLKSTELDVTDGVKLKFEVVKDTALEDANRKDPVKDKELPSPKPNLSTPSKI